MGGVSCEWCRDGGQGMLLGGGGAALKSDSEMAWRVEWRVENGDQHVQTPESDEAA